MGNRFDKQKELETIYLKVVKNFPEIKKEDIKTRLDYRISFAYIEQDRFSYRHWTLAAGNKFLTLPENLKESIIAHELGHYCHVTRRYTPEKDLRYKKWIFYLNFYYKHKTATDILKFFSKKHRRRAVRIERWYLLTEIHADKKALESGYGQGIIDALKFFKDFSSDKESVDKRIKNLESKLKEERT